MQKKSDGGRYFYYSFTEKGKSVYDGLSIMESGFDNRLKLEVIESIEDGIINESKFSKEEFAELVHSLIDNDKITEILLKPLSP